jgi:hypothetical protein
MDFASALAPGAAIVSLTGAAGLAAVDDAAGADAGAGGGGAGAVAGEGGGALAALVGGFVPRRRLNMMATGFRDQTSNRTRGYDRI